MYRYLWNREYFVFQCIRCNIENVNSESNPFIIYLQNGENTIQNSKIKILENQFNTTSIIENTEILEKTTFSNKVNVSFVNTTINNRIQFGKGEEGEETNAVIYGKVNITATEYCQKPTIGITNITRIYPVYIVDHEGDPIIDSNQISWVCPGETEPKTVRSNPLTGYLEVICKFENLNSEEDRCNLEFEISISREE